jgi:hypothetical protein
MWLPLLSREEPRRLLPEAALKSSAQANSSKRRKKAAAEHSNFAILNKILPCHKSFAPNSILING